MLFHNHLLFFKGTWFHVCTYTGTDNTHLYSISDLWERERDRKSENLKISYKAIGVFQIRISHLLLQTQQINKDKK